MFVIIVENALQAATVVGPFAHEEDGRDYGDKHYKLHIRRTVRLVAPEKE